MGAAQSSLAPAKATALKSHKSATSKNAWRVLAWGQNSSQQCGVATDGLLLRPRVVPNIPDAPIASLHAGYRHSAMIAADGAVCAWGRNVTGELGIGRWCEKLQPRQMTAFEDGSKVRSIAMGHGHTVFCDSAGGLWTCGSNNHGQLGLGTPLPDAVAQQVSQTRTPDKSSLPVVVMKRQLAGRLQRMGLPAVATGESVAPFLVGMNNTVQKQRELQRANNLHAVEEGTAHAISIEAAALGLRDVTAMMEWHGLGRAEVYSPARVGLDGADIVLPHRDAPDGPEPKRSLRFSEHAQRHKPVQVQLDTLLRSKHGSGPQSASNFVDLLSSLNAQGQSASDSHGQSASSLSSNDEDSEQPSETSEEGSAERDTAQSGSIHRHSVVKVAAGRDVSYALTEDGQVWAFGCGPNHQLSSGNYTQTDARPLGGKVAALIAKHGGATDIAAGEVFCVVLAKDGAVVSWGKHSPAGAVSTWADGSSPMRFIAAGRKHALFSDGEFIWHCSADSTASQPGFSKPALLKPSQGVMPGITQLAAGGDASAAIDGQGKLWMWGRIADATQSDSLPPAKLASGKSPFPCFNSHEPRPVPITGLDFVHHVALGSNHVLAATQR